jgi:hypothetical protein
MNNYIELLNQLALSIRYVTDAPYFMESMVSLTCTAIFIGAAIYDGDMKNATRGIITTAGYVVILFIMTIQRVTDQITSGMVTDFERAWAGSITMMITTLTYILGIIIGVAIFRFKGFKK